MSSWADDTFVSTALSRSSSRFASASSSACEFCCFFVCLGSSNSSASSRRSISRSCASCRDVLCETPSLSDSLTFHPEPVLANDRSSHIMRYGAIEEGVSAPDERVLAALGHAVEPKEPLGVAL